MNRYLLFVFTAGQPAGGFNDFIASFINLGTSKRYVYRSDLAFSDTYQIVDREKKKIIAQGKIGELYVQAA